jgi:hypothetical protein
LANDLDAARPVKKASILLPQKLLKDVGFILNYYLSFQLNFVTTEGLSIEKNRLSEDL